MHIKLSFYYGVNHQTLLVRMYIGYISEKHMLLMKFGMDILNLKFEYSFTIKNFTIKGVEERSSFIRFQNINKKISEQYIIFYLYI